MSSPPRCTPDDPSVTCDARRQAQRAGEFYFDSTPPHFGWKFVAEPSGEYRPPSRFSLTFCPYCGGDLPDAASMILRLFRENGEGAE